MPPIPIHTASPISTKAPKPFPPSPTSAYAPTNLEASTPYSPTKINTDAPTTPIFATTTYPAARPGAPAYPAPTGTTASTYTPLSPTRTTQWPQYDGPPMPQAGAVPVPDGVDMMGSADRRASLPPPPRAGEKRLSMSATTPPKSSYPTQMPPQFSIPPPNLNYAPTHSTSTTSTTSPTGPTIPVFVSPMPTSRRGSAIPTPTTYTWPVDESFCSTDSPADIRRGSLQHPPGYVQNPRAVDMTAAQRAAQEMAEKEGGIGSVLAGVVPEGLGGGFIGGDVGGGTSGGGGGVMGDGEGGAWDKAKSWLGGVAGMVGEVEEEVWRRVAGK